MANSIHVQLADRIVVEMNDAGRSWNGSLTAVRSWTPWYKTKTDIEALQAAPKCAVVPLTLESEWLARNKHKWDYGVAIDVQRMFDLTAAATSAAMDLLDSICQDVQDFYDDGHSINGMTTYVSLHAERPDVYSVELLHGQSIWETLIMVGIRGHR